MIAEELGRALAPVPFSSTVYLAAEAMLLAGSEAQKQKLSAEARGGRRDRHLGARRRPGRRRRKASARRVAAAASPAPRCRCPTATIADFAVVAARTASRRETGISLFLVDLKGDRRRRARASTTIDPSRKHARLDLRRRCRPSRWAPPAKAGALISQVFDRAAVLIAFEQVGGAERALDMATTMRWSACLRPADRLVPGDQAQARRHVCRHRAGALQRLLRRLGAVDQMRRNCRWRPPRRASARRRRSILRQGKHPDPWRHGLHLGVRLPSLLSPRQAAGAGAGQPRGCGRTVSSPSSSSATPAASTARSALRRRTAYDGFR